MTLDNSPSIIYKRGILTYLVALRIKKDTIYDSI